MPADLNLSVGVVYDPVCATGPNSCSVSLGTALPEVKNKQTNKTAEDFRLFTQRIDAALT